MQFSNISKYLEPVYYYNFFIGGRGVGKTYSTIQYLLSQKSKFLYMRTSTTELELAAQKNDFAKIKKSCNFQKLSRDLYGIYDNDKLIGYGVALSTFKNLRGIDFSDIMYIFFDEFIAERSARKVVKYELDALLNLLESINHNREFENIESCRLLACANANEIYNAYFLGLKIVDKLEEMLQQSNNKIYRDPDRCLQIVVLEASEEFKNAKKSTPLYKLASGTDFEQMSLENNFAYNDFNYVKKDVSIIGHEPILQIDDYVLWKKKNDDLYVLKKSNGKMRNCYDSTSDIDIKIINKLYSALFYRVIANGNIYFQNYEIKRKLFDILKLKC